MNLLAIDTAPGCVLRACSTQMAVASGAARCSTSARGPCRHRMEVVGEALGKRRLVYVRTRHDRGPCIGPGSFTGVRVGRIRSGAGWATWGGGEGSRWSAGHIRSEALAAERGPALGIIPSFTR